MPPPHAQQASVAFASDGAGCAAAWSAVTHQCGAAAYSAHVWPKASLKPSASAHASSAAHAAKRYTSLSAAALGKSRRSSAQPAAGAPSAKEWRSSSVASVSPLRASTTAAAPLALTHESDHAVGATAASAPCSP